MSYSRYIAWLLVAIFSVAVPFSVLAQTKNLTSKDAAGIQVSPVVDEFNISPSVVEKRSITIDGLTNNTLRYYPIVLNFEADKKTGEPVFLDDSERLSRYALSSWVSFNETSFTVGPGEKKVIDYTVTAPADASPGGHYGAVLFSTEKPKLNDEGVLVGVVGLIGTLVLATVPGDITEQLLVTEFISPAILFAPPANFKTVVGNNGNVHARVNGGITIRNWFGRQSTYLNVNESKNAILPESQRTYDNAWQFNWLAIGRYTANLSLQYGDNKSLAELRTFYVIPYWFILLVALLIIGFVGKKVWGGRRRKTKHQPPSPPRPSRRIVMG